MVPRRHLMSDWMAACAVLLCLEGCATVRAPRTASDDLPAFAQVDEGLYRGGQPSAAGFERLARLGIKTIVTLRHRSRTTDRERRLAEQLGMRWVNIPMWYWWRPSDRQVRQFLAIVTDPRNRPVFVHCHHGWNRVGVMVAIYRVAHHHWPPEHAYAEGRRLGLVAWNPVTRWVIFREAPRAFATVPPQSP